jgi:hypothetical protein
MGIMKFDAKIIIGDKKIILGGFVDGEQALGQIEAEDCRTIGDKKF